MAPVPPPWPKVPWPPWPAAPRSAARRCSSTPTRPSPCWPPWRPSRPCAPCTGRPTWKTCSSSSPAGRSGRAAERRQCPLPCPQTPIFLRPIMSSPITDPTPLSYPPPPSAWRAPSLSTRWWPVFLRNLLVWRKLAIPSLVGNIAEPLMWLVAFGYGMGALVGQITVHGPDGDTQVPYILFLASGSICMRENDLGRHHERPRGPGRRGAGRDAVGCLQGLVHRHGHHGRDAGAGHQPQPQAAAGLGRADGRGGHVRKHRADLQCPGQGLRLLHLLLHPGADADDVPVGHLLPARAVARAGAHRL